jgi:HEAT repeat protein
MAYMRHTVLAAIAAALAAWGALPGGKPISAAQKPLDPDEELLQQAKIGTDGASLLVYLRKQSGKDADLLQLDQLIRQLGDKNFKKREQASKKIIALGPCSLRSLLAIRNDPTPELAQRARECIRKINQESNCDLHLAAVRVLAQKKPPGTLEAILRFLPYAADEETEEEIWYGLDALAESQGKPDPALVAALTDVLPPRRSVAGCTLGRRGSREQQRAVRKLLEDANAKVRLRAAQGLLASKDKMAIPALIALLVALA